MQTYSEQTFFFSGLKEIGDGVVGGSRDGQVGGGADEGGGVKEEGAAGEGLYAQLLHKLATNEEWLRWVCVCVFVCEFMCVFEIDFVYIHNN